MKLPNMDLRNYALHKRVRLWQVAQALGFSDNKLYRDMRVEFDEAGKQKFRDTVDRIAQEAQENE